MVDADLDLGRDDRLGMQGNASAGQVQHAEIVGAIANGKGVCGRNAESGGNVDQRIDLGLLAEDRLCDSAGEMAVFLQQDVGAVFVKAKRCRNRTGEDGKATGNQGGIMALALSWSRPVPGRRGSA